MRGKRDFMTSVGAAEAWIRREKALSCALFGIALLLLGFIIGHLDERIRFVMDLLSCLAFAFAAIIEKSAAPRMVWILLLVASVVFVQMDYRLSTHLTQTRSEKAFEAR